MAKVVTPAETIVEPRATRCDRPGPAVDEDVLNWDVVIEPRPARPSGTIQVELCYRGRGRPLPVSDPWAD